MRVGKLALMVPVMTSTDGPLRRHDEMDAGRAGHLRKPLDRALDVLAGDHHEIGHFVDDDDDIGQFVERDLLGFVDRFAGLAIKAGLDGAGQRLALGDRLGDAGVEAVDVAHADLRHLLVALLHLPHRPFERDDGLLRVGDDGGQEVGDAVVGGKLEHLRIDHDEPASLGLHAVEEREDHGVDRDRLARAGRAGDQEVRHAGQIDDHRLAADGLAERDRQAMVRLAEIVAGEKLAQIDGVAALVRQFDADGVAALNDRHAGRDRRHRAGDVVGEPDDPRGFDPRRRFEFVEGHDRTRAHVDDLALHAEIVEDAFQQARVLLQRVLRDLGADRFLRLAQHRERGHDPFAARPGRDVGPGPRRRSESGTRRDNRRADGRSRSQALSARRVGGGDDRNVVDVARPRPRRGRSGSPRSGEDGRRDARSPRAARGHPAQRCFRREQGMNDSADRHHAKAGFVLVVFIVEARQRPGAGLSGCSVGGVLRGTRRAPNAGGAGEAEDSDCRKATAQRDRGPGRGRQEAMRERQNGVADDAAEAGGQRPAPRRGKQGSQPGRRDHSGQIEADLQARPLKPPLGDQAPTPERGGRQHDRRGKAEELHHEVGGDRAGSAETDCGRARWSHD